MPAIVLVGAQWGDEGKGKATDLLGSRVDYVVRYQGGNNAGHTVVIGDRKFALHLLPSGIFRKGVVNVLGNGAVIDPEKLLEEMDELRSKGISITPENLKVSDRAPIVFPYHRDQDALEEARLADAKYGSTKRGIAPVYGDKYMKKTIMLGELFYPEYLKKRLEGILEWKNLTLKNVYGGKTYSLDEIWEWLMTYGEKLKPFICDTEFGLSSLVNSRIFASNPAFERSSAAIAFLTSVLSSNTPRSFISWSCQYSSQIASGTGNFTSRACIAISVSTSRRL